MKEKILWTTFSTGFIKKIIKFYSRYTSKKSEFAGDLIEPLGSY